MITSLVIVQLTNLWVIEELTLKGAGGADIMNAGKVMDRLLMLEMEPHNHS